MKFKKIISAVLAAVIACSLPAVGAAAESVRIGAEERTYGAEGSSFVKGDLKFTEFEDGTLTVGQAYGLDYAKMGGITSVNIPSEAGGKKVTEIEPYAFWHCDNLKTVTIPDEIIFIREYAFTRV